MKVFSKPSWLFLLTKGIHAFKTFEHAKKYIYTVGYEIYPHTIPFTKIDGRWIQVLNVKLIKTPKKV